MLHILIDTYPQTMTRNCGHKKRTAAEGPIFAGLVAWQALRKEATPHSGAVAVLWCRRNAGLAPPFPQGKFRISVYIFFVNVF